VIWVYSAYYRAKGLGWLRSTECSIRISRRRSLCFLVELLILLEETDILPKSNNIGVCLKEEGLCSLVIWKLAPEFFRVFAISIKLTNFGPEEEVLKVEYWL
jgi:hypothetical protein